MKKGSRKIVLAFAALVFLACRNDLARKPIDAKTRERIDSLANAEIRRERERIDSFYAQNGQILLKKMKDSITIERRREIDEQIKAAQKGQ